MVNQIAKLPNYQLTKFAISFQGDAIYLNRRHAGAELGRKLARYNGRDDVVVLGLPRGGVPVAFEVAQALGAELDIFVVRKLGVPGQRELAMGAIASGGIRVLNHDVVSWLGIARDVIDEIAGEEQAELERRERLYRGDRPPVDIRDRIVVLVDDGLATGSTMRAAVQAVRKYEPSRIVVAVPVAPRSTCTEFESLADEVVCAQTPEPFSAVGQWYREFSQTIDDEVRELLQEGGRKSKKFRATKFKVSGKCPRLPATYFQLTVYLELCTFTALSVQTAAAAAPPRARRGPARGPANPSVTLGSATPRSTAAEPGFSRKSKSSAL